MAPGAMYSLDKRYVLVGSVADDNESAVVAAVGDHMFETTPTAGKTAGAGPPAFVIDGSTGDLKAIESARLTGADLRGSIGCQWFAARPVKAGPYTHIWYDEEAALKSLPVNHRATALYGSAHFPVVYGTVAVVKKGVVA